jgi:hypothetical protein
MTIRMYEPELSELRMRFDEDLAEEVVRQNRRRMPDNAMSIPGKPRSPSDDRVEVDRPEIGCIVVEFRRIVVNSCGYRRSSGAALDPLRTARLLTSIR